MTPEDDISSFHDDKWGGDIDRVLGFWEEQGIYLKESFKRTPSASMVTNLNIYEATTGYTPTFVPGVGFMPVGQREPLNKLTKEQWEQSPYYRDSIDYNKMASVDGTVTDKMAQLVADAKDKEQIVSDLLSNSSQNTLLGQIVKWPTMFAAQLMDPLNIMASMIPVYGPAKYASHIEKFGKLGRVGVKSAQIASNKYVSAGVRGAVDGMVGNAIVEPPIWSAAAEMQEEYNYMDSLVNVGFGAVMGGGLKLTGTALYPFVGKVFKHSPDEANLIIDNGVNNILNGEGVDIDTSLKIIEKTNTLKTEPDTPRYSLSPDGEPVLTPEGLDTWRKADVPEELLEGPSWESSGPSSGDVPKRPLPEWVSGLSDIGAKLARFLPDEDKHLSTIIASIFKRGEITDVEAAALKKSTFLKDIVNASGDDYTNEQLLKDILHIFHKTLLSDEELAARAVKVQQEVQGILEDAENAEIQRALREEDESSALFSDPEEAAYYESIIADEEARLHYDEVLNDGTIHPEEPDRALPEEPGVDVSQVHYDEPQFDMLDDELYTLDDFTPIDPQAIDGSGSQNVGGPPNVGDPPIGPLPYAPTSPMAKWVAISGETPASEVMPTVEQKVMTTIDENDIYTFTNDIKLNIIKMLKDMSNLRELLPRENFGYFYDKYSKHKLNLEDIAILRKKFIEDWVVMDRVQLIKKYVAVVDRLIDDDSGRTLVSEFLPAEVDLDFITDSQKIYSGLVNEYTQRLEFLRKQYPGERPTNIARRVLDEYHEKDIANLRGYMYSLLRRINTGGFIKKYMSEGKLNDMLNHIHEDMVRTIIAGTGVDIRTGKITPEVTKFLDVLKKSDIDLLEIMRPSKKVKGPTEVDALEAFILGIMSNKEGAGLSIDYLAKAHGNRLKGQLENDLMKAYPELGILKKILYTFAKEEDPDLTKAIAAEMWNSYYKPDDVRRVVTKDPKVKLIAEIYKKYQHKVVRRLNELGAHIKEMNHYIIKQTHDRIKLERAGFDQWYENTINKLDLEKTFGDDIEINASELKMNPKMTAHDKIREFMVEAYNNLIAGRYQPSMFSSPVHEAGLISKLSKHREFIFKSAEDFLGYNDMFGTRSTIFESIFRGLDEAGKNIALLEKLGSDPHATLDDVINDVINSINKSFKKSSKDATRRLTKLEKSKKKLHKMLNTVDGTGMIPDNIKFAWGMASLRKLQDMAKLGFVWLSSLNDIPAANSELIYNGVSYIKSITSKFDYMLDRFEDGVDKLEFTRLMGVGLDHLNTELVNRFTSSDGVRGMFDKMHSKFFELNWLQAWTDGIKRSTGITLGANIGINLKKFDYNTLLKKNPKLASALRRYGITDEEWAVLQKVKLDAGDILLPDAIEALSDTDVRSLIYKKFSFVNKKSLNEVRLELANKYRVYLLDRIDAAVPTPGGKERLLAYSDTKPGSVLGEALRAIMQFKSYGITYVRKVLGREFILGEGSAIKKTSNWITGLALPSLIISAGVGWAKDILSGRKPRDYTDVRNLISLVVQSGIGGLVLDSLFSMQKGYGVGIFDSLLGPTVGTVRDIGSIGYDVVTTAANKRKRFGRDTRLMKQTYDVVKANFPYNNLFYTKLALDYSILYSFEELLDPGAARKKERSLKKRTGQEYFLGPRKRLKPLK